MKQDPCLHSMKQRISASLGDIPAHVSFLKVPKGMRNSCVHYQRATRSATFDEGPEAQRWTVQPTTREAGKLGTQGRESRMSVEKVCGEIRDSVRGRSLRSLRGVRQRRGRPGKNESTTTVVGRCHDSLSRSPAMWSSLGMG